MVYIILSIIGILAVLLLKSNWTQKRQIIFIFAILTIGLIIIISINFFFFYKNDVIEKGISSFLKKEIPWLDIGLYFIMLLGMASKYFFDAIGEEERPKINKWKLFKPIFVSPIIFGTIYGSIGKYNSAVLLLIFSFQNGFFWQTVLAKE